MCSANQVIDRKAHTLRAVGTGLLANGLILRILINPKSPGAQNCLHFCTGLMLGIALMLILHSVLRARCVHNNEA